VGAARRAPRAEVPICATPAAGVASVGGWSEALHRLDVLPGGSAAELSSPPGDHPAQSRDGSRRSASPPSIEGSTACGTSRLFGAASHCCGVRRPCTAMAARTRRGSWSKTKCGGQAATSVVAPLMAVRAAGVGGRRSVGDAVAASRSSCVGSGLSTGISAACGRGTRCAAGCASSTPWLTITTPSTAAATPKTSKRSWVVFGVGARCATRYLPASGSPCVRHAGYDGHHTVD
jgi:hypothetical protein